MDVTLREPLLLFSHPVEMAPCLEGVQARTHSPFRAERVGIGRDAGHRTVHLLTEREPPSAVLVLGSAGWLHRNKPPPGPVWVKTLASESGQRIQPSLGVPAGFIDSIGLYSARLVTVRRPVLDYGRALELAERLNADMVDMESFLVCQACIARGIHCGVIRGVTDLARPTARQQYRSNVEAVMRRVGQAAAPLIDFLDKREQERVQKARRRSS